MHGKCQEFHWDINGISRFHASYLFTVESFVSPTTNIYIINVSSDFWTVMAVTLSFHLEPKINIKKINNIREINIMKDFILVFIRINENCLLVDLDLHLNSEDSTRICSCLSDHYKDVLHSEGKKSTVFRKLFSLYFSLHTSLCYIELKLTNVPKLLGRTGTDRQ